MSSRGPSRRRAHIAMIGVPMISHVLPGLEIIRELAARGHRVTYADDPAVAHLIEPTGAELVPYDSTLPHRDNIWPDDPIEASALFLDDAMAVLPQLRAVYDDDPADLYLYDIGAYVGRALAEAQGRPVVQLSPTFVAWGSYQEDVGAHLARLPGADVLEARFKEWLAGCGATTLDVGEFSGVPPRALATIPRAMQPHADTVGPRVDFVGPCFGDRARRGGWARPEGAEKVLLVSLGSAYTKQPEFYRRCVAAFGDLPGWHVVLQIGKHVDPAELGANLPANIEVRSWVPQLAILEQADAFVTHAGMGSSSEGLYTGVPMIAVPQGAEQPMNADRLVELGVARRLDTEDATGDALRSALLALVSDPEVAERCARLKAEVRAEGGTSRAADLIEAEL
ncbi:macrolide family glycosyltransferase [Streptomyces sp. NPDC015345]|uniref:macrolide family glycosyltransferase n=1 Tax=Streptomyces sp. NPDC015345 TaxID=3364953 RepID=UPI0036FCA108